MTEAPIDPSIAAALSAGDHGDPFSVLGLHKLPKGWVLRVLAHGADAVEALSRKGKMLARLEPAGPEGLFTGRLPRKPRSYKLRAQRGATTWEFEDPYRFGPVLGDMDVFLLAEGSHRQLWEALGAHPMTIEGVSGVHFAVWAPNARRVSVVGDFNHWDGRRTPMRRRSAAGVWEIFLPGVPEGARYKYEIKTRRPNSPIEGGPGGLRRRTPTCDGLDRARTLRAPLARRGLDGAAGRGDRH